MPIGMGIGLGIGASAQAGSGGGGGGGGIDIPSIIGSSGVWYDGSDLSTIVANGSNQITQWASKVATNVMRQTAGSAAPLAGDTLNGLPAVDMRSGRYMLPDVHLFPSAAPYEAFVVQWSDRSSFSANSYTLWGGIAAGQQRVVQPIKVQNGGTTLSLAGLRATNSLRTTQILHTWVDGYTGTVTQSVSSNDRGFSSGSSSISGRGAASAVGASNTGSTPANTIYGEIIIAYKVLTDAERTQIKDYLKAKWRSRAACRVWRTVAIIGQSNNRGEWGPINRVEDLPDPRIAQLGRVYDATTGVVVENALGDLTLAEHPLQNRWRDTATPPTEDSVGPSLAFAKALLASLPADEGVLLVPCAQGGSFVMQQPPLSNNITWHPSPTGGRSNAPYTDTVARVNRVLSEVPGAVLHSLVWHQGESEAAQAIMAQATYAGYLDAVINGLRASITGASSVPVVLGELGTFLSLVSYPNRGNVNAAILDTPNRLAHVAVASSTGLTDGGDGLHFDAASARTLGSRQYSAYQTI